MRYLSVLLVALLALSGLGGTYPTTSGSAILGGGSSESELSLAADLQQSTNFTSGNCWNLVAGVATSLGCTTIGSRFITAKAVRLTRWVVTLNTNATANAGCGFTLVTDAGDVATVLKPALGDDTATGFIVMDTGLTEAFMEAIPVGTVNATTAVGGWFQVRFNDVAGASVGDDGTCASAATTAVVITIYGVPQG